MGTAKKGVALGLLGLVAGGFMVISCLAGQGSSNGPPAFSDSDVDGNGFISEEEFNTFRAKRMSEKAAEGKQLRGAASAPAFADIDLDGDGKLSPDELTAAQKAHMGKHHGMQKEHHHGDGKGRGNGKGSGCGSKTGKGKMPTFKIYDIDGDGKITETEFNRAHAKRMSEMAEEGRQMNHAGDAPGFPDIDIDDNGEISEEEFAKHQKEHHQQMQKKGKEQ
jgi:Ca2+-binding EF-hand superfamily protein